MVTATVLSQPGVQEILPQKRRETSYTNKNIQLLQSKKKILGPVVVARFNHSTGGGGQVDLSDLEASLVYKAGSRPARAVIEKSCLENQTKPTNKQTKKTF